MKTIKTARNEMSELENNIIKVAKGWNLYPETTIQDQLEKLQEEIEEFEEAHFDLHNAADEQMELGDVYVVLVNIAAKLGYSLERCGHMAYEKIKTRTGKMINGQFVRDDK
ncbi:hypothetical protein C4588_06235 [Candidatus Parcubacteria bacterium]|nr:MAG: hypothetical protein C4588_06235 [Candidatus Parcubacteria bacterium]